ncbi:polysaccharide biosynthesis tyrosine autokinase [Parendozoicomonas sp. Alg238-R29]|uniref:GumC family protein n=1 Tax=Parendozoicomonas sp. Alg238-R29 TaxID=2993446 RepID=UPI00248E8B73|nr:polysaccharide biosynthesis tyrosine autokinase [Parendozoicomonas sp. Alg238-R29]
MTQPTTPAQSSDEDIISLSEIFHTLNNHKWSIIGFTFAVTLLAVLIVFSLTPIYQATAVLQIEQEQAKVVSIEEVYGLEGGGDSYLNTQYEVLKSRAVLEKVVHKLNLLKNPEFNTSLQPAPWYAEYTNWRGWFGLTKPVDEDGLEDRILNDTVDVLAANVSVQPVKKTQIVKVSVTSENPKLAARIANEIANAYIGSYLEAKLSLTTSATSWMQQRLEDLSGKLKSAEQQLQDYREQENLIELEGVLTISNNELKALTTSLVEIRQTLTVSGNIYRQIQDSKKQGQKDFSSLPAVLSHPLIQDLKQEESKAERSVQELSRRYGPKHPKMIAAQSDLRSIQANINSQINRIVSGIESEYRVAKANEASLAKAVAEAKSNAQTINRKQFQLRALEREVKTNKDLYDAFFKRIQETSATSDLQTANARIVDKAFTPKSPVKPKKSLIVVLSALLGLMISSGMAFLLEMMNNTVRSARDVEDRLNLPVLGLMPNIKKKTEAEIHQLFNDKNEHIFGEAVRTIRTSLSLTALDKDHRIFAVTSSIPGEGKSTVSCNLALAMGQLGKTLIIGCDLRRPTLGQRLGMKGGLPGLANVLSGAHPFSECIHSIEGLDVMPSGLVPPNPQELLASERFKKMLESLRKVYDTIILDCPPVQSVSDALMVGKVSDGLIYVVESSRVHVPVITHAVGRLLQARAPITGVVLNKVDPNKKDRYGYNYGYYDYEGYSSKG